MAKQKRDDLAVIILAAGAGTRMKSKLPKVLHPIAGRAMVSHVLDTARGLQAGHIIAVVRHERDRVSEAILDHAPDTIIVDQDEVMGTGRAVEMALAALPKEFAGSVAVLSGDVPLIDVMTLEALVTGHEAENRQMTILSANFQNPKGLGRIIRDTDSVLTGIVEEKDATDEERLITEINGGIYVFERPALEVALSQIGTNNAQGEKYLTDAAAKILAAGGFVDAVPTDDNWLIAGVNDRAQLSEAATEFNRRIVRRHQLGGVSILDPLTTWIDADVSIEPDCVILPGTFLQGATTIMSRAVIGPDTTLIDCEVREGAHIRRSEATLAVICEDATVGPFSYLRPGTNLGEKGKIGAFVEAKNARIGEGSKVPHLSYVGDIVVGEGSNIGAGTIVANYDGEQKYETHVGDAVRIGSQNVLVAPVNVCDGAYTAAGAVIRKNVPEGALGMSVVTQRNINDWVLTKRPGSAAAEAAEAAKESKDEE